MKTPSTEEAAASMSITWHPTPPPPPGTKILHSRRSRRKKTKSSTQLHRSGSFPLINRENLKNLFDQENDDLHPRVAFSNCNPKTLAVHRREIEEGEEDRGECGAGGGANGHEEKKWMFQAEVLRAECSFLREEREFALKKLERRRVEMERTLRSAVQTLVSERKKIAEGKSVNATLENEMKDLSKKLEKLHKSSRIKDDEILKSSTFDEKPKACLLRRPPEIISGLLPDESCLNELQGLAESNLSPNISHEVEKPGCVSTLVDELRTKMEELSKGMLDRVLEEEYGPRQSSAAASSVSDAIGIECANMSSSSARTLYQVPNTHEGSRCSGHCRGIFRRILEQVRADTEQWSQMQEMLGRVRGEMEELEASRDFWRKRAHDSDHEMQSLKHAVEEWKEKALVDEINAKEAGLQLSVELGKSRGELKLRPDREIQLNPGSPGKQPQKLSIEEDKERETRTRDLPSISLEKQLAKKKRTLRALLKEKREKGCTRREGLLSDGRKKSYSTSIGAVASICTPLQDIGNSSALVRQNGVDCLYHSPRIYGARESFRK